jgi:hypothetical protein
LVATQVLQVPAQAASKLEPTTVVFTVTEQALERAIAAQ